VFGGNPPFKETGKWISKLYNAYKVELWATIYLKLYGAHLVDMQIVDTCPENEHGTPQMVATNPSIN